MNLKKLKEPFPAEDIEWRVGRCGKKTDGSVWCMALTYITARAIHDRLDDVCGIENWKNKYRPIQNGVVCGISIRIGDEWITKWGGSDETNMEAYKGMLSGSEKRAGVPWGIGRYLYHLKETFVETSLQKVNGWKYQSANSKKGIPAFYWKIPELPKWALPESCNDKGGGNTSKLDNQLLENLKKLKDVLGDDGYEKAKKYCSKTFPAEYKISASSTMVKYADTLVDLYNSGELQ